MDTGFSPTRLHGFQSRDHMTSSECFVHSSINVPMSSYDNALPPRGGRRCPGQVSGAESDPQVSIRHQKNLPQTTQDIGTGFTAVRKLQKSIILQKVIWGNQVR